MHLIWTSIHPCPISSISRGHLFLISFLCNHVPLIQCEGSSIQDHISYGSLYFRIISRFPVLVAIMLGSESQISRFRLHLDNPLDLLAAYNVISEMAFSGMQRSTAIFPCRNNNFTYIPEFPFEVPPAPQFPFNHPNPSHAYSSPLLSLFCFI